MTLTDQLNRLSEIAPEVCRRVNHPDVGMVYRIGYYNFWVQDDDLYADLDYHRQIVVYSRPALAWLRDALEGVIEVQGWDIESKQLKGKAHVRLFDDSGMEQLSGWHSDKTEALLAAFVAVMEER